MFASVSCQYHVAPSTAARVVEVVSPTAVGVRGADGATALHVPPAPSPQALCARLTRAGLALLRLQGRDLFNRLREAQEGRLFGPQIFVDDMAVGLAALLLMVPGLITDTLALLVLIGPLRRRLSRWLFGAPADEDPYGPGHTARDWRHDATIEGDYTRVDDDDGTPRQ